MANLRTWITVTPAGLGQAQQALNNAGLEGEISLESWVAYPSIEDTKLFWVGLGALDATVLQVEATIDGLPGVHHYRGPLKPNQPALTFAQIQAQFPDPASGPSSTTIVTKKAALWAHYRDEGILPFDDDGSPGVAPEQ
jgi:hypothetical protein